MKNRLLLLLSATLLFGACTKHPVLPDLSTRAVDTVLHGKANFCNVEYRFASILNAAKSPALRTIEQANIGYFFQLEEFSGTFDEALQTALTEIQTNFLAEGGNPAIEGYEISVEAEGTVVDSILCYTITRAGYTGGAHGMYSTECHNYSLRDGFELSLADLFSDKGLQKLDVLIREKIAAQYHATTDDELTEAGFFPEYLAPTENFLLSPEGMTFYYNPYDIGCYALGEVIVTVSPDELKRLRSE